MRKVQGVVMRKVQGVVMRKVQGVVMRKVQGDIMKHFVIASSVCSVIGRPIAVPSSVITIILTVVLHWFQYKTLLAVFTSSQRSAVLPFSPAPSALQCCCFHLACKNTCQSLFNLTY
jgi:hypothetical protein